MDKPIEAGDMVQVIRPISCCGADVAIGWTFIVTRIRASPRSRCRHCHQRFEGGLVAEGHPVGVFDIPRLKRIPPLSELEGEKQKEDLREPA